MSAGICIMNKNAVALAADSAVTVGNRLAIYNTANKIFALSKIAPIGAIMYSNVNLMDVPMEIVLGLFKEKIGNTVFNSLEDCVNSFLRFIIEEKSLFKFEQNEKQLVLNICSNVLRNMNILTKIGKNVLERKLSTDDLKQIEEDCMQRIEKNILKQTSQIENSVQQYIYDSYLIDIKNCIMEHMTYADNEQIEHFASFLCLNFDKLLFQTGYMGLVFAGYGEQEIFPQMIHIHIFGIINNVVCYFIKGRQCITGDNPSSIAPLAQEDVMHTFLFGINNSYIDYINKEIRQKIEKCINDMEDDLFAQDAKCLIQNKLLDSTNELIQNVAQTAQTNYFKPIMQSITALPIHDLALLAESMINITSLRRKIALDGNTGTVGGPVDVAIITKYDGFVWIKRKHYFDKN